MAAAKLVTRCPACRTAFRLVADQLRLRRSAVASATPSSMRAST
ncbi:zinc-ribbon domain-containing protein [Cupriavidus basilensis]|nr:zinc-ribbon domain-containing protein [Cupriavidus basilensis]